jgi:hypothetical protein
VYDDVLWFVFGDCLVSRKLIAMTLRIGDRGPLALACELPLHTILLRSPLSALGFSRLNNNAAYQDLIVAKHVATC